MNDSFLEELEPILKQSKKTIQEQVDCHVTTRRAATSSPLLEFSEQDERDNATRPQKKHSITGEKTEKILDSKGRPAEIKIKIENKQHNINEEQKVKLQEARYLKVPENKVKNKDHIRRSGSHKETIHSLNTSGKENRRSLDSSNHSFDASSKENSRPPDSVKEGTSIKEKEKVPNKSRKSGFKIQDQDPVGLLTAIKELISTYTKQESTKILRAMEELHVNSQTTLIKNLLNQTDDLIKEMHSCKDSARLKTLIEENEQLQQELAALRVQNEDQQNKLEFLKQENAALKLKCHELT
ncbi:uncharacterized protein [Anoplolepis gracilipes]|uniref:uncharacterized protein isoform X2 n=1 Tax=Anoplolepis gracilipes TaxID=354296 RepID=UPI003BA0767E